MKYVVKYVTADLDACRTKEEWKNWFLDEGNHNNVDGWSDFNSWWNDMLRGEDLMEVSVVFYKSVKPLLYDMEIPVLISYYAGETNDEGYYSIAYDGCTVSGEWEDIEEEYFQLCGKKLEIYN